MAVDDLFQVTCVAELQGQPVLNVYHFRQLADSGAAPEQENQLLGDAFRSELSSSDLITLQASSFQYLEAVVQNLGNITIAPPPPVGAPIAVTIDEPGQEVAESLPSTLCALTRRSPSPVPAVLPSPGKLPYILGRNFISGLPDDGNVSGNLLPAFAAACTDWIDTLVIGLGTPAESVVWTLINYSRAKHKANDPIYFEAVFAVQTDPIIHSLRPRRKGTPRGGF